MRFALEVHPTEIAYDFVTTRKALAAIGDRAGLRDQLRPEPLRSPVPRSRGLRRPSSPTASTTSTSRTRKRRLDGRARSWAATWTSARPSAAGTSSRPGHGDVDFEALFRALNRIGYDGPLSIEWEDSGMDREWGAPDALAFVRRTDFAPSAVAFDAAFAKEA